MNPKAKKFLAFVKSQCKKHGVKFVFSKERFVMAETIKCNGFFDDDLMELQVAGGQPFEKWLRILTHEYGHMTQWLDNCKAWQDIKVGDGSTDSEKVVTLWMDREVEFSPAQKQKHISRARGVELDCEMRTVNLIVKHKLPLDVDEYIKTANAYVWFWTYVGTCRKWYTIGKEPYNTPEIVALMPAHFCNDYNAVPRPVAKLFKRITHD